MNKIEPYKKKGVEKRMKAVYQYDLTGNLIQRYKSISDANRQTGIASSAIVECCKERRLSAGNYMFRYA